MWKAASRRPLLAWAFYLAVAFIVAFDIGALLRRAEGWRALSVVLDLLPAMIARRIAPPEPAGDRFLLALPPPPPAQSRRLEPILTNAAASRPAGVRGILSPREAEDKRLAAEVPLSASALAPVSDPADASAEPRSAASAASGGPSAAAAPDRTAMVEPLPRDLPPVYGPDKPEPSGARPPRPPQEDPGAAELEARPDGSDEGPDDPLADTVGAAEGYAGAADDDGFRGLDESLRGEDLMDAVLGRSGYEDAYSQAANYGKNRWKILKNLGAGYKSPYPNLTKARGRTLKDSRAAYQLAETALATSGSYFCRSCSVENRVNNNRSTYFGELYQRTTAAEIK